MSDLTEKFTTLETQLAAQSAATQAYIDTVEPKIQSIIDFLDIMAVNNAANTKAIIAALGQTGTCFPCPSPSITVPPTSGSAVPVDTGHCQRAQAFIATIHNILAAMDTMQSFNVIGTYNVVSGAISEVIDGIASGDTVPLPSFPETVNIVGNYISYAGERLFSGVSLLEQFTPLESGLIEALYAAGSAEAAQAAYNSYVSSADVSLVGGYLIQAVGYNALYSYFFDPETTPDLSGFNGLACGVPEGCFLLSSISVIATDSSYPLLTPRQMIYLPDWTGYDDAFLGTGFSEFVVMLGGSPGATITQVSGGDVRIVHHDASGYHSVPLVLDEPYTLNATTDAFFFDDVTPGLTLSGSWAAHYCPAPE